MGTLTYLVISPSLWKTSVLFSFSWDWLLRGKFENLHSVIRETFVQLYNLRTARPWSLDYPPTNRNKLLLDCVEKKITTSQLPFQWRFHLSCCWTGHCSSLLQERNGLSEPCTSYCSVSFISLFLSKSPLQSPVAFESQLWVGYLQGTNPTPNSSTKECYWKMLWHIIATFQCTSSLKIALTSMSVFLCKPGCTHTISSMVSQPRGYRMANMTVYNLSTGWQKKLWPVNCDLNIRFH